MNKVKINELSKKGQKAVREAFGSETEEAFIEQFDCLAGQEYAEITLTGIGFVRDAFLFGGTPGSVTVFGIEDDEDGFLIYSDGSLWFGTPQTDEIWTRAIDYRSRHAEKFWGLSQELDAPRYMLDFNNYCDDILKEEYFQMRMSKMPFSV